MQFQILVCIALTFWLVNNVLGNIQKNAIVRIFVHVFPYLLQTWDSSYSTKHNWQLIKCLQINTNTSSRFSKTNLIQLYISFCHKRTIDDTRIRIWTDSYFGIWKATKKTVLSPVNPKMGRRWNQFLVKCQEFVVNRRSYTFINILYILLTLFRPLIK